MRKKKAALLSKDAIEALQEAVVDIVTSDQRVWNKIDEAIRDCVEHDGFKIELRSDGKTYAVIADSDGFCVATIPLKGFSYSANGHVADMQAQISAANGMIEWLKGIVADLEHNVAHREK